MVHHRVSSAHHYPAYELIAGHAALKSLSRVILSASDSYWEQYFQTRYIINQKNECQFIKLRSSFILKTECTSLVFSQLILNSYQITSPKENKNCLFPINRSKIIYAFHPRHFNDNTESSPCWKVLVCFTGKQKVVVKQISEQKINAKIWKTSHLKYIQVYGKTNG